VSGLNKGGVLDDVSWELREGLTELGDALGLHLEMAFLCHGGIPNVVRRAKNGVDQDVSSGREAVGLRIMGRHVDDGVDIGEGDASEVPENNQEAPFLMVHIPSLRNAFLTLATSVDIESSCQNHECHVWGHVAVCFVLLASPRNGEEEDDDPGDANLGPHFQVDVPQARVEHGTHEIVVEKVSRHANGVVGHDGEEVGDERDTEAINHGHAHEMTIVVDDLSEPKNMVVVQSGSGDDGRVQANESVAVVHECLVAEGRDGETFLLVTGKNPCDEKLEKKVAREDLPCVRVGTRVLGYVSPHAPQERLDVVDGRGKDELPVVEGEANPEVVH